jgi:aspartyl-tRNA(Asn)/glutamyl-tRNA(Gln) amidotransferase subunit A
MPDWPSGDRTLWNLGIAQTLSIYRDGVATPLDMLDAVLRRTKTINPTINAFAFLDLEGARAAAKASTERWHKGQTCGPLDGIVLTIKDNITVRGMPCSWGTEVFRDYIPDRDEVPVARLRAAGARCRLSAFCTSDRSAVIP